MAKTPLRFHSNKSRGRMDRTICESCTGCSATRDQLRGDSAGEIYLEFINYTQTLRKNK